MSYVVTGPLAIVKNEDGSARYIYQGGVLPSHLKGDEVQRLVDAGLVEKEGSAKDSDDKPAGNGSLEDWQEYARSQGASDADLEGQTRDDLRKTFG